jgi:rhodanese-related sulfurtransferase
MFFFNKRSQAAFKEVSVDEYQSQFTGKHQLIDVREPSEFKQGHLPGAVNIPLGQIASRTDDIAPDTPVVLVCASGNRSGMAARSLVKAGYGDVYNLKGGTISWMRKGLKIEK